MRLVITPEADQDTKRLYKFLIDRENPTAAENAMIAIDGMIDALLSDPYIGHPITNRAPEYRQHYAPFGKAAYVMRYHVEGNALTVLRLWHSREDR